MQWFNYYSLLSHTTVLRILAITLVVQLHQYNAFWSDQRGERDSGPCTCEIATGYLQLTCGLCTAPHYPVPNRVSNLSAIGPGVLGIWNRHPARAHVQGKSQFTLPHQLLTVPVNIPSLSATSPSVLDIWNIIVLHVRTCSRTPTVTHRDTLPGGCLHACEVSA